MSGALIVCIENDPAILDGMKTLLTAWDAEVIAVADPDAAIAAIETSGSSVTGLLVDYHLDRGNGVAAIREIRRRFGENIPAILITADRSPNVRAAAREENIAILNKPVKPASLRALLGQWRAQQLVAAESTPDARVGVTSSGLADQPYQFRIIKVAAVQTAPQRADRRGRGSSVFQSSRCLQPKRIERRAGILDARDSWARRAPRAALQIRQRRCGFPCGSSSPIITALNRCMMHNPRKHHSACQAGRVGYRHHGDVRAILRGTSSFIRPPAVLFAPTRACGMLRFHFRHDGRLALRRLTRQKSFADRSIRKPHQLFRGAVAIEHVACGANT